ncbi:MAG: phage holin family protein [Caldisericia bacterium]|nr:phage holin family protein [Caldisericia bacterium]
MRKLAIAFISNWICFLVVGKLFPSWISVGNWESALMGGIILGLSNIIIRPILVIITLPLQIITLGLFSFFINVFLLFITSRFIPGIEIFSFWPNAFFVAIAFGVLNWVLIVLLRGKK